MCFETDSISISKRHLLFVNFVELRALWLIVQLISIEESLGRILSRHGSSIFLLRNARRRVDLRFIDTGTSHRVPSIDIGLHDLLICGVVELNQRVVFSKYRLVSSFDILRTSNLLIILGSKALNTLVELLAWTLIFSVVGGGRVSDGSVERGCRPLVGLPGRRVKLGLRKARIETILIFGHSIDGVRFWIHAG